MITGTLSIWNRIGRATGAQAISLSVMEFAPGESPAMVNEDCDHILYVLNNPNSAANRDCVAVEDNSQGQAQSTTPLDQSQIKPAHSEGVLAGIASIDIIIDGQCFVIDSDSGVYLRPAQTFGIYNRSAASVNIISSKCPDPDRAPRFVNAAMPANESGPLNPSPIVRLADQKAQPTADRWYRVLIDERVGSTQATQFVGSIPRGRAPDHFHHYEEVLFILKGEGRMWAGESNTPIAAGSCIYLPKGQVHCVENTGEGELRLLGVFYPAGSPSVRYDV